MEGNSSNLGNQNSTSNIQGSTSNTTENSQTKTSEFNLSSIDQLLKDQEKCIKELRGFVSLGGSFTVFMSDEDRLAKLQDLFNETQKLRIRFLSDKNMPVTVETAREVQTMLNELMKNYEKYVDQIYSMDPITLKKTFDITNSYTKTNSKVLKAVFEKMREDIKLHKPEIYEKLNKDVFNKYKAEADASQNKMNNLKRMISKSISKQQKE